MLSKMATGRSYNVIRWLTEHDPNEGRIPWSFTMLVSIASNHYLPYQINQGACDLLRVLYLDRYPQLPYCGRPSLPERLWVYQLSDKSADSNEIAVVRPISNQGHDRNGNGRAWEEQSMLTYLHAEPKAYPLRVLLPSTGRPCSCW